MNHWPQLIKQARQDLGESQASFGKRFGVSHAAVGRWERGVSEAPNSVTWWIVERGSMTDDYQRGLHVGFHKALRFVRKLYELGSLGDTNYLINGLEKLIEEGPDK